MRPRSPSLGSVSATPADPREHHRPDAGGTSHYLPYDILVLIFGLLQTRHIVRLIKTCRYYRNLLEPLLYRHLDSSPSITENTYTRCFLLHRTLQARPDLLPCVLTYCGPVISEPERIRSTIERARRAQRRIWDRSADSTNILSDAGAVELAKSLFVRMVNLRTLELIEDIPCTATPGTIEVLEAFGVDGSGIKLENLTVPGSMDQLPRVLRTQPELKGFEVCDNMRLKGASKFTSDLVPGLVAVKASLWDATDIVPGRPVKVLNVIPVYGTNTTAEPPRSSDELEERFAKLAQSTSGIVDLTLSPMIKYGTFEYMVLRWVPRYLPQVERLSFIEGSSISDDLLLEILPGLANLSYLQLPGVLHKQQIWPEDEGVSKDAYDDRTFLLFVQLLKEGCLSLVHVDWPRPRKRSVMSCYIGEDGDIKVVHRMME